MPVLKEGLESPCLVFSSYIPCEFIFFFFLGGGTPMACGGSQARGQICDLHHSSQQRRIFNPLSEARDQTSNLVVPSWICFC